LTWNIKAGGVGKELAIRRVEHFSSSERLVEATDEISNYYLKIGFKKRCIFQHILKMSMRVSFLI
jgi:hypothetical protein